MFDFPDDVNLQHWVMTGMENVLKHRLRVYAGIFLFATLLYSGTFGHGFVFDDVAVLSENTFVQRGVDGASDILTRGSWDGYEPEKEMRIYRPFQLLALAVQYEVFGMNPFGYHAVNVLTYAGVCVLVLHLLLRWFSGREDGVFLALATAILFLAHPVHTEVVSNIKGNGDLLALLFGLMALVFVDRYAANGRAGNVVVAGLMFSVSLFCKEIAVSFIGVALLSMFFFRKPHVSRYVAAGCSMFVPLLVYLMVRQQVFGSDAQSLDNMLSSYDNVLFLAEGWSEQVGTRLYALGKNLKLLVFPYPLQMMYVYDGVPVVGLFQMESLFPGLIYLGLGAFCLRGFLHRAVSSYGLAFYFGTLLPYTHTLLPAPNLLGERWLLIPSLGFCVVLATLLQKFWMLSPKGAVSGFLFLVTGYAGYTVQRSLVWESDYQLSQTDLRTSPEMVHAQLMFARAAYARALEEEGHQELLRQSAEVYERYLWKLPYNYTEFFALGDVYELLGEHAKAALYFARAAELPWNLAVKSEEAWARNLMKSGQYVNALRVLDSLASKEPSHPSVAAMRILAELELKGGHRQAEAELSQLIEQHPNEPWANEFLAEKYLYRAQQRGMDPELLEKSVLHYQQWLYADPDRFIDQEESFDRLGQLLAMLGRPAEAAEAFVYAARWDRPVQSYALRAAGENFLKAGDLRNALLQWNRLVLKKPQSPSAVWGRVRTLKEMGESSEMMIALETFFRNLDRNTIPEDERGDLEKLESLWESMGLRPVTAQP